MIATVTFGLGINIKDIKTVINYGFQLTSEECVQESGTAGKNGIPQILRIMFSKARLGKQSLHPCSGNLVHSVALIVFSFSVSSSIIGQSGLAAFLFLTNHRSRLKMHSGFFVLFSFISNFDV